VYFKCSQKLQHRPDTVTITVYPALHHPPPEFNFSDQYTFRRKKSKEGYSSLQAGLPSPLRELTCHMGSQSVTCHPAEVTFPPLPQPKLVLDLAIPEGCKAELTQVVG